MIIQAQNLTRKFGALTAVDHLNLEVNEGEIFALVGPDGAGKTTTMRLLCGLMDPTEGKAIVAGHDVSRELNQMKDQIGYMAQRFGLYTDLTVAENMAFYSDLFGIVGSERTPFLHAGNSGGLQHFAFHEVLIFDPGDAFDEPQHLRVRVLDPAASR